jgi:hypothetical protein
MTAALKDSVIGIQEIQSLLRLGRQMFVSINTLTQHSITKLRDFYKIRLYCP